MLLELLGTAREPLPECHPPDAAWSRPGSAFLKASHGEPRRMCRCATHHAVISAGDPGSPPRLLAAVGRPLVNDRCLQKFADAKYVQMIPNVSHVQVKIKLRAAGHAGIPPTPLQVELHWNYHSAPHDDLHSEAPNLRQKSLANDKQLLFSQ